MNPAKTFDAGTPAGGAGGGTRRRFDRGEYPHTSESTIIDNEHQRVILSCYGQQIYDGFSRRRYTGLGACCGLKS